MLTYFQYYIRSYIINLSMLHSSIQKIKRFVKAQRQSLVLHLCYFYLYVCPFIVDIRNIRLMQHLDFNNYVTQCMGSFGDSRKPKAENWEEHGVLFSQIPLADRSLFLDGVLRKHFWGNFQFTKTSAEIRDQTSCDKYFLNQQNL